MTSQTGSSAVALPRPVAVLLELFRPPLLWQLVYVSIAILLLAILAIWFVAVQLSDDYRLVLAERYHIDPGVAHRMFLDSMYFAFVRVGTVAVVVAGLASALMTRRILKPLRDMADQVDQITDGDFGARVAVENIPQRCEIRMLGASLNRMAEKLDMLEQLRRNMVSNLAHDLLTPLTNLRGYLEGLREGVVAVSSDVLAMLEGEVRRLVRLVEDLHQLAVADYSKRKLRLENFAVEPLLKEAAAIFDAEFMRKELAIEFAAEDDAQTLTADREMILRILRNLIQNAVRYSYHGGVVELGASKKARAIEIRCESIGAEIPQGDLSYIFDRFYRTEAADAESESGVGLGLAIVKELAEAHGGDVGASSVAGKTVIWVSLPLEPATGEA